MKKLWKVRFVSLVNNMYMGPTCVVEKSNCATKKKKKKKAENENAQRGHAN